MATLPTYLSWAPKKNPALGKLRLQSMGCAGIFFSSWVHHVSFDAGYKDIDTAPFPVSPYTLNRNSMAKRVSVPGSTTLVRGTFTDCIGDQLARDIAYTVKVYLWVETNEEANGIAFDFQEEANDDLKEEQW